SYSSLLHLYISLLFLFFFYGYAHHLDLHSFPTRRSSDLDMELIKSIDDIIQDGSFINLEKIFNGVQAPGMSAMGVVPHLELFERSEEHTSELQSRFDLVCRLLLEKKNT